SNTYLWYGALSLAGVVVVVLGFLLFWGGGQTRPPGDPGRPIDEERPLEQARKLLTQDPDAGSARNALQLINAALADLPSGKRPASLAPAERTALVERFGLDASEVEELTSQSFPPLDAHYLDSCFLLRSAARGQDVDRKTPALERARLAFAWAVR